MVVKRTPLRQPRPLALLVPLLLLPPLLLGRPPLGPRESRVVARVPLRLLLLLLLLLVLLLPYYVFWMFFFCSCSVWPRKTRSKTGLKGWLAIGCLSPDRVDR